MLRKDGVLNIDSTVIYYFLSILVFSFYISHIDTYTYIFIYTYIYAAYRKRVIRLQSGH